MSKAKLPKLLYFIGVDWFFFSHFLDRALAARAAGFEVVVLTRLTRGEQAFERHGIRVIPIDFARRSIHPKYLLRNLRAIVDAYRREQPDIIHQVALKPILLGSIAARWLGFKRVVNAVVGMGFAYTSTSRFAGVIRFLLSLSFLVTLDRRHARIVFENTDDLTFFVRKGWVKRDNAVLIRGAGVDLEKFRATNQLANPPVVMLLSRMLWDKGVREFVDAARIVKRRDNGTGVRFVLVGDSDDDNRGAISRETLQAWQAEGVIEWWGFRPEVEEVLAQATISCLPSYREGLPKSLLESLAMGLPCIATDVPGCREAVLDGVNGYLVPARDSEALAQAIQRLLNAPDLLERFGKQSRKMVVDQFSADIVNNQTLALYRQLMASV